MPTAELRLPPEPQSVGTARRWLRGLLDEWQVVDLEFAGAQGLSELATNAVIHARTEFRVTVEWADGILRVCVRDFSRKLPMQRSYAEDSTTGRGLTVLKDVCRSWGVERTDDGKQVWFELAEVQRSSGGDDDEQPVDLDKERRERAEPSGERRSCAGGSADGLAA